MENIMAKNILSICTKKRHEMKTPLIIKKRNITKGNESLLVNNATKVVCKEDIMYQATANDFLKGKYPNLKLVNLLDVKNNSSVTVATYTRNSERIVATSTAVTKIIGQKNYDTVFASLCSIISQEMRVQGILALLTVENDHFLVPNSSNILNNNINKTIENKIHKTDKDTQKLTKNVECQTEESSMLLIMKDKQKKKGKIKRPRVRPYVVKDKAPPEKVIKKVIIDPQNLIYFSMQTRRTNTETNPEKRDHRIASSNSEGNDSSYNLPDIKQIVDEDSNMSDGSIGAMSSFSQNIPDSVLHRCTEIMSNINKHTYGKQETPIKLFDGSQLTVNVKLEDIFHLATPDVLQTLPIEDQKKLILHQAYIDYNYCLQRDEDNNLIMHTAVQTHDVDLLRRQCSMLRNRGHTVDEPGGGNLTALQMAILHNAPECTPVLLKFEADPLVTDDEVRTTFHLAAEGNSKHLEELINYCKYNARKVLRNREDLWKPYLETKPDEELAKYLLHRICTMFDEQGYNPLMIASRMGNSDNVELLINAAPLSVNMCMPNSGKTALYLAVESACHDAENRSNKSKIGDNFKKTVEILIVKGADPSIDNDSGNNVNTLLTDLHMNELSVLIANKVTSLNFFKGKTIDNFDSYTLYKDSDGKVEIFERKNTKPKANSLNTNNCIVEENADIKKEKNNIPVDTNELKTINATKVVKLVNTNVLKKPDISIDTKDTKTNKLEDLNIENIKIENESKETNTNNSVKPKILMNIPIKTNRLTQVTKTYLRNPSTSTSTQPHLLILSKPETNKSLLKPEYLKNIVPNITTDQQASKRKPSLTLADTSKPKIQKQ